MAQIDRCTIVLEACTGRFIGRGSSRRLVQVQRQREGRELLAHFAASALACKSLHRSRRCVASTYPVREPQASVRLILGSSLKWIALCAYPLNFLENDRCAAAAPCVPCRSAPSCNQTGACISAFGRHCPNRSCSSSTALSMCCRPKRTVTAASISPPRGRGRATAIASVAQAGRGLRARSARRCISSIRRGCDCRLGALLGRRLRGEAAYHLRLRRRAPDRRRHHARAPQQHHRRPGFADCSGATYVILTLAITTLHSGPVSTTPVAA